MTLGGVRDGTESQYFMESGIYQQPCTTLHLVRRLRTVDTRRSCARTTGVIRPHVQLGDARDTIMDGIPA